MISPSPLSARSLTDVFQSAEKSEERWLVGLEAEKFGFDRSDRPLQYEGPGGIRELFSWLQANYGWQPYAETEGGPIVALQRDASSITLEPAGQFELSGAPHADVHAVAKEYDAHLSELRAAEKEFGTWFAHVGFHPTAELSELPWVPKRRYPIMREYLPTQGARGLDMMQRTSTVQVNLDYASEADAMLKLSVLLKLTPLIQAMTAHAPFVHGKPGARKSERLDVWLNMDPKRSGLIKQLWSKPELHYEDYVQWALDAGMFLFIHDGQLFRNTGQTFREFMRDGFQGERPTEADWRLHLGTLFPEVRLKTTLEVRGCDSAPPPFTYAIAALLTGLVYDAESFQQARALADRVGLEDAVSLQRQVASLGLEATLRGEAVHGLCMQLLELAHAGLKRRARIDQGADEALYLEPLIRLVERRLTPADVLLRQSQELAQSPLAALHAQWDALFEGRA